MNTEFEKLMNNIEMKKYNTWIKRNDRLSKRDLFLMFSGIRIYIKHLQTKYTNETLPNMSDEEYNYYDKLTRQK